MIFSGIGRVAGIRTGKKNEKTWMMLFVDDCENPIERLQLYVPVAVQSSVSAIPVGSDVRISVRFYSPRSGYTQVAGSLDSISVNK